MDFESKRISDFSRSDDFLADSVNFEVILKDGQKFVAVEESTKLYSLLERYVTLCDVDHDIDQCIEVLSLMFDLETATFKKKEDKIIIARSLWRSAVISYGRVAKKSNARKNFRLEPEKVYVGLAYKYLSFHTSIISERDKYQAHADRNGHEAIKVLVAVGGTAETVGSVPILVQGKRGSVPKKERVRDFLEMLSFLKAYIGEQKQRELSSCEVTSANIESFLAS